MFIPFVVVLDVVIDFHQFYYGLGEKKGIAWAPWGPKAPCPLLFPLKTTTKLMNINEIDNCSMTKFTAALEIVAFRTLWMGCSDVVDGLFGGLERLFGRCGWVVRMPGGLLVGFWGSFGFRGLRPPVQVITKIQQKAQHPLLRPAHVSFRPGRKQIQTGVPTERFLASNGSISSAVTPR